MCQYLLLKTALLSQQSITEKQVNQYRRKKTNFKTCPRVFGDSNMRNSIQIVTLFKIKKHVRVHI
jgi:hypothetical protein